MNLTSADQLNADALVRMDLHSSDSPFDDASKEEKTKDDASANGEKKRKKSTSLPAETVDYLKNWMMSPEHIVHPYPTETEKQKIMEDTGITLKQLTNWFVNNRKRYWKPQVEQKLKAQNVTQSKQVVPLTPPGLPISFQTYTEQQHVSSSSSNVPTHLVSPKSPPSQVPISVYTTGSNDHAILSSHEGSQRCHHVVLSPLALKEYVTNTCGVSLPFLPQTGTFLNQNQAVLNGFTSQYASSGLHQLTTACISESDTGSVFSTQDNSSSSSSSISSSPGPNEIIVGPRGVGSPEPSVEEDEGGNIIRKELVDVHITRPLTSDPDELPTIKDVTILAPKGEQQVLRSYIGCPISYSFSPDIASDRKKVQSRRDAEIVRVKKHYLRFFLFDVQTGCVSIPAMSATATAREPEEPQISHVTQTQASESEVSLDLETDNNSVTIEEPLSECNYQENVYLATQDDMVVDNVVVDEISEEPPLKKFKSLDYNQVSPTREHEESQDCVDTACVVTPVIDHKKKVRCITDWRRACQRAARSCHDTSAHLVLPSLEEASIMFGH